MVVIFPTSGSDAVLNVVSELRDPYAKRVEDFNEFDVVFEGRGVLESEQHGRSPFSCNLLDVIAASCERDEIAVLSEKPVPSPERRQGFARALPDCDCDVDTAKAAGVPLLEAGALGRAVLQGIDHKRAVRVHGVSPCFRFSL